MSLVRPEGFEPPTLWFVAKCSIQLSYGRTLRGMQPSNDNGVCAVEQAARGAREAVRGICGAPGEIRTPDPLVRSHGVFNLSSDIQENLVESRPNEIDGL